jgi:hypothetical protein
MRPPLAILLVLWGALLVGLQARPVTHLRTAPAQPPGCVQWYEGDELLARCP